MKPITRIATLIVGLALGFTAAVFSPSVHAVSGIGGPHGTGLKPASSSGGGGGAVSSVTGTSGLTCSPTTGSVSCSLTSVSTTILKTTLTGVTGAGTAGVLAVASDGTPSVALGGLALVQAQTVGSDTNDITFSGLNGNTDVRYKLVVYGIAGTGVTAASGYQFEFNGGSISGYVANVATSTGSGTTTWAGGTGSAQVASGSSAAGDPYMTEFEIMAKTGNQRTIFYRHIRLSTSTATNRTIDNGMMYWTDTSTAVTAINVHSSANIFGVGTMAWLYKYQVQ